MGSQDMITNVCSIAVEPEIGMGKSQQNSRELMDPDTQKTSL